MRKIFSYPNKWEDAWYIGLPIENKLAFDYVWEKCTPIGIWKPSYKLCEFCIGKRIKWDVLIKQMSNDKLIILTDGSWWLIEFIKVQYGVLDEESTSPPIKSYIKDLKLNGIWDLYKQRVCKGYAKGIQTLKDNTIQDNTIQDKINNKINNNKEISKKMSIPKNVAEVRQYCSERKNKIDPEYFYHFYDARDWRLKNGQRITRWKSVIITWERNRPKQGLEGVNNQKAGSSVAQELWEAAEATKQSQVMDGSELSG